MPFVWSSLQIFRMSSSIGRSLGFSAWTPFPFDLGRALRVGVARGSRFTFPPVAAGPGPLHSRSLSPLDVSPYVSIDQSIPQLPLLGLVSDPLLSLVASTMLTLVANSRAGRAASAVRSSRRHC